MDAEKYRQLWEAVGHTHDALRELMAHLQAEEGLEPQIVTERHMESARRALNASDPHRQRETTQTTLSDTEQHYMAVHPAIYKALRFLLIETQLGPADVQSIAARDAILAELPQT